MELILYTLRTVAYAIIEPMHILMLVVLGIMFYLKNKRITIMQKPMHILMLVVLGIMFYLKNKRITIMQKMTIGESINSPLELTLSQISLGIIGGVIVSLMMSSLGIIFNENSGIEIMFMISILLLFIKIIGGVIVSLMMSSLGIIFNENSGIEIMFMISILLLFIKKRFICFSYSGAVLGMISILSGILSNITNTESYINVNILSLMTFVGIMHVVEGVLVIFDGGRGAIPVFSNRNDKIVGGFAYNRYWALPVAIFIAFSGSISSVTTSVVDTPNWWPIINRAETLLILSTAIIGAIPLYGVIGYNSVSFTKDKIKKPIYSGVGILIYGVLLTLIASTAIIGAIPLYGVIGYNSVSFTKDKIKKPIYSGVGILIYGVLLTLIAQVSQFGVVGQIVVIAFAPLGHEIMIRIQNKIEEAGKYIYVTDNDGVSVLEVSPTSPAYEAGIRRGDKIIEVNNVKTVSEVEIFKIVRDSIEEISFKIRRISGEMLDLTIIPKNKRLGLLLVPKMVKVDDALSVDNDDFKKVLEQMKRKR